MQHTRCLLCESAAERTPFGGRGWKYQCSGPCPDYAVPVFLLYYLEMESIFPAWQRKKISDFLVNIEPDPERYYVLTKADIERATGKKIL